MQLELKETEYTRCIARRKYRCQLHPAAGEPSAAWRVAHMCWVMRCGRTHSLSLSLSLMYHETESQPLRSEAPSENTRSILKRWGREKPQHTLHCTRQRAATSNSLRQVRLHRTHLVLPLAVTIAK